MKNTEFKFNKKPLSLLSVGCMRFDSREQADKIINYCADNKVLFLDTSPMYCFQSEEENTETWTGNAIKNIRDKVILSAKCSTGNGGMEIGDYNKVHGFSVTTADQVRELIEQSLRRLNVDYFDVYQLWAAHNEEIYKEAFKKGGWMEGVLKAREEGLFKHLGITTHSDNEFIKMAVDEGIYEVIIAPFNIVDNSRLEGLLYAQSKNVAPIVMNPLAGGMLSEQIRQTAACLSDKNIDSSIDLSIRYITSFGFSALAGMSNLEHAKTNMEIMKKPLLTSEQTSLLRDKFLKMIDAAQFQCTSCGYCMPCPKNVNIPEIFKLWNKIKVLKISEDSDKLKKTLLSDNYKIQNCNKCTSCESKCPNNIEIVKMLDIINETII